MTKNFGGRHAEGTRIFTRGTGISVEITRKREGKLRGREGITTAAGPPQSRDVNCSGTKYGKKGKLRGCGGMKGAKKNTAIGWGEPLDKERTDPGKLTSGKKKIDKKKGLVTRKAALLRKERKGEHRELVEPCGGVRHWVGYPLKSTVE